MTTDNIQPLIYKSTRGQAKELYFKEIQPALKTEFKFKNLNKLYIPTNLKNTKCFGSEFCTTKR